MTGKRHRHLSDEDRMLWNLIARTVEPLRGKSLPPEPEETQPELQPAPKLQFEAANTPPGKPAAPHPPATGLIDRPTRNKIAKGRIPLEASVDLHGLTQTEAHSLLLSFLHRAHAGGLRHVLVITGKGSSLGSDGVLRRAVPDWLRTSAFRGLVSGFEDAARNHGGSGALYVRLRRREGKS